MQRSLLLITFLSFSTMACSLVGGVPATPTLVPSPFAPTATLAPTTEPPTLIPTLIPRAAVLPTSTPVRLGQSGQSIPSIAGLPTVAYAPGGVSPNNSNPGSSGAFSASNVNIAGSTLELPAQDSQIPIDFDVSRSGHTAVIGPDGSLKIDGAVFNGNGKLVNKHFSQVRWSPDGRWLAFVIQTPGAETSKPGCDPLHDDGLWVLDTGSANNPQQIYRHAYNQACDGNLRIVQDVNWAWDNDAMMLTVKYPTGVAQMLVGRSIHADDRHPGLFDLLLYSQGTWQPDSQGYVTVTANPGHGEILGVLHRDVGQFTPIADGGVLGLTMQDAVQLPDGRYAFLGKPGAQNQDANQLALYTVTAGSTPTAVSAVLPGEVISASCSPNRSALLVLVKVGGQVQTKVITLDGAIADYSAQTLGSSSAHWNRQQS